ncbi:hypothetical protein VPG91_11475 [Nitrospirillum amazonense]|uniref:hypothetical protein n=1 Tax=Nitrospirillum amazonense TaxID=28077 RepID=UPI002DD41D72|nr:hypothetical protein [Nitrospirillum amazonense]MEC4591609.1 hypothetical protein [Nitrospirillum amazonense]
MSKNLTERFEMRLSPAMAERLDDWRRGQKDLPSRAEAIRRLTLRGLRSRDPKPTEDALFTFLEALGNHGYFEYLDMPEYKALIQAVIEGQEVELTKALRAAGRERITDIIAEARYAVALMRSLPQKRVRPSKFDPAEAEQSFLHLILEAEKIGDDELVAELKESLRVIRSTYQLSEEAEATQLENPPAPSAPISTEALLRPLGPPTTSDKALTEKKTVRIGTSGRRLTMPPKKR